MTKHSRGRVELICGSMFSGKTEELIRRLRRAVIVRQKVQVFKPLIDDRYHEKRVTSHNGLDFGARPVSFASEILTQVDPDTTVIAIDEVQFFDEKIVDVIGVLRKEGKCVIAAGLDLDFRGLPFGPMEELIRISDHVRRLTAICTVCKGPANLSQRLINGRPAHFKDLVYLPGGGESYEPRCRKHHVVLKEG